MDLFSLDQVALDEEIITFFDDMEVFDRSVGIVLVFLLLPSLIDYPSSKT